MTRALARAGIAAWLPGGIRPWIPVVLLMLFGGSIGAAPLVDPGEPDSREAPRPLEVGPEVRATISPVGDTDWWAVRLPGAGILRVELTEAAAGEMVPEITVETEDGKALLVYQPPPGARGRAPVQVPGPGLYRIAVRNGPRDPGEWGASHQRDNRESREPYGLRLGFEAAVATGEPDGTRETARALPLEQWVEGSIFPVGDADRYRVEIGEPGWLQLALLGIDPPLGPALVLEDAAGKAVATLVRPAGHDLLYTAALTEPGTWFLAVRDGPSGSGEWNASHQWDNQSRVEPYRLRARLLPRSDPGEPEDAGTPPPGRKLGAEGVGEGRIWPVGDRDTYGLDVPEPGIGVLKIELSGMDPPVSPRLVVTDPEGRVGHEIVVTEGMGIAVDLPVKAPGRYRIMVGDGNKGEGEWVASHQHDTAAHDGKYRISARFLALPDPGEPDSAGAPRRLRAGESVRHRIFPAGDQDFFAVGVPGPGVLEVEARAPGDGVSLEAAILSEDGSRVLASHDAPENRVLHLTRGVSAAGEVLLRIRDGCRGPGEWAASHQYDNRYSESEIEVRTRFHPGGGGRLESRAVLDLAWPVAGFRPRVEVVAESPGTLAVVGRDGWIDPRPILATPAGPGGVEASEAGPWFRVLEVPAGTSQVDIGDGPGGAGEWNASHQNNDRWGGLPVAAVLLPGEPGESVAATPVATVVVPLGGHRRIVPPSGNSSFDLRVEGTPGSDGLVLLDGWTPGSPPPRVWIRRPEGEVLDERERGRTQAAIGVRRILGPEGLLLRILPAPGMEAGRSLRVRSAILGAADREVRSCERGPELDLASGTGERVLHLGGIGDARSLPLKLDRPSRIFLSQVARPRPGAGRIEATVLEFDGARVDWQASGDGQALHAELPLVEAGRHCLTLRAAEGLAVPLSIRIRSDPFEPVGAERVLPGTVTNVPLDRPGVTARRLVEAVAPGLLDVFVSGVSRRLDPRVMAEVFPLDAAAGSATTWTADATMGAGEGGAETLAVPIAVPSRVILTFSDPRPGAPAEPKTLRLHLVHRASPDSHEPDSVPGSEPLLEEAGLTRCLFPEGDVDWFRVSMDEPGELSVWMETPAPLSPRIEVFAPGDRTKPIATMEGLHGQARGHPEGDRVFLAVPGQYLVKVHDPNPKHFAIDPYRIGVDRRPSGPDLEIDAWDRPVRLASGVETRALLHPAGQEDFFGFRTGEKGRVEISLRPEDRHQDLSMTLRRRPPLGVMETRVLHLIGTAPSWYHHPTPASLEGVQVERREWNPAAPTPDLLLGLELERFSSVVLDHIGDPKEFGLDRDAVMTRLESWIRAGGRLLVTSARPHPPANSPQRGARLIGDSPSQHDTGNWSRESIHDGRTLAGNMSGAWSSAHGAPAPHVFTWDLGVPVRLSQAMVQVDPGNPRLIPADVSLETADRAEGPWRQVVKAPLVPGEDVQRFAFAEVMARFARVSFGAGVDPTVQVGEVELSGPDEASAQFMGAAWRTRAERSTRPAEPGAPLAGIPDALGAQDLPSYRVLEIPPGSPLAVIHRGARGDPVVAARIMGKGSLWVDSMRSTDGSPERLAPLLGWRHPLTIGSWNETLGGAGFDEWAGPELEPGDYVLKVGGTPSLRPYRVAVRFPEGGGVPPARLLGIHPPDGTPGLTARTRFSLAFDAPVDPDLIATRVRLGVPGKAFPFEARPDPSGRSVVILPREPLPPDTELELSLAPDPGSGSRTAQGTPGEGLRRFRYRTWEGSSRGAATRVVSGQPVVVDLDPPEAPRDLVATALPRGSALLAWRSVDPGAIATFAVWGRSGTELPESAPRELARFPGEVREGIVTLPAEGDWQLELVAFDAAGNRSLGRATARVQADATPPDGEPAAPGLRVTREGQVVVDLPVWPQDAVLAEVVREVGGPVGRVAAPARRLLDRVQDGTYGYRLRYLDEAGNAGRLGRQSRITVDTTTPVAALRAVWEPAPLVEVPRAAGTMGLSPGGRLGLILEASEDLPAMPEVTVEFPGRPVAVPVAITGSGRRFRGTVEVGATSGPLILRARYADRAGRAFDGVVAGGRLWISPGPPAPPHGVTARSLPEGAIELAWEPASDSDPQAPVRFRVEVEEAGSKATVLAPGVTDRSFVHRPTRDGRYSYRVRAVDEAGRASDPSEPVEAVADRTAPPPPSGFADSVAEGKLRISWSGETGARYTVTRLDSRGTEFALARGLDVPGIEEVPPGPGVFTYRVVAEDPAGNRSSPADRRVDLSEDLPSATIGFDPPLPLRGAARVTLDFDAAPASTPRLAAVYPDGLSVPVRLESSSPVRFHGSFQPREFFEHGEIRFAMEAPGKRGLVGRLLRPGDRFLLDGQAPRARLHLEAPGILVPGRETGGRLVASEVLAGPPRLGVRWPGGQSELVTLVETTDVPPAWSFAVTPPSTCPDGEALLSLRIRDAAGNEGSEVEPPRLYVDRSPPLPPVRVEAAAMPRGQVRLSWRPAPLGRAGTPDPIVGYRVLRAGPMEASTGTVTILEGHPGLGFVDSPPEDGRYTYTVVAQDRAGWESEPSAAATTTADRRAPDRPAAPKVEMDAAGLAVSWEPAPGEVAGFELRVREPGRTEERVLVQGSGITRHRLEPVADGNYRFLLLARDGLGHLSEPGEPVEVAFTRRAPAGRVELPGSGVLGAGAHILGLRVDRPISGLPVLSLEFVEGGGRIPGEVSASGDGFRVRIEVPSSAPSGPVRLVFEARGSDGTPGRAISGGEDCRIDTRSPSATVRFEGAPRRRDKPILGVGLQAFVIESDEPLAKPPEARVEVQGAGPGGEPKVVPLALSEESKSRFTGVLEVADDGSERDAVFLVRMQDEAGNQGEAVTRGRHALLDAMPPRVPQAVRAVSMPEGKVRIEWTLPWHPVEGEDRGVRRFRVWRVEGEPKAPAEGEPWREVEGVLALEDRPGRSGRFGYSVAAVDLAGNPGVPSGWAMVEVDADPPEPPVNLRARVVENGSIELAWDPPPGKVLVYNAWLGSGPGDSTEGLTSLGKSIPFTRIYGTPQANGRLWMCVTAIDDAWNESRPSSWVSLEYDRVAPIGSFFLEPDIWLTDGSWPLRLETTLPLVEPPTVTVHGEDGSTRTLVFRGRAASWETRLEVDPTMPEGTYGLRFSGRSVSGTVGIEVARGPLFHVDRTAPLPPSRLRRHTDPKAREGAVGLAWNTPARPADGSPVEIPHRYDIFRARRIPDSPAGLEPIHTLVITVQNVDDYAFVDLPPEDGDWSYTVASRDLAGNRSAPAPWIQAVSSAREPRASIRLFTAFSGPVPTTRVGPGEVRVELETSRPLSAPPRLEYRVSTDAKAARYVEAGIPVALSGTGTRFAGSFRVEVSGRGDEREAAFSFLGTSKEGIEGRTVGEGERFLVDTAFPEAEVDIPRIRRFLPDPVTMKPTLPPLPAGEWPVEVRLDEEVVAPPDLAYRIAGGDWVAVPLAGSGRDFKGVVRIGPGHAEGPGELRVMARDLAGNYGGVMAEARRWFLDDESFPTPRVLEAYSTTGGTFAVDRSAPQAPPGLDIEVKNLGVAVLTAKVPEGERAARWNLYRDLFPIRSVAGRAPIQKGVFRSVFADAPPRDGTWYYVATAEDLAGNESPPSPCVSMFVDSIKPELKITAVPMGDDFFLMLPEDVPPGSLTAELRFPGGERRKVELGGSSGELAVRPDFRGTGRPALLLPEKLEVFDGTVEVVVHSPDPKGNLVETRVELPRVRRVPPETGGTVTSADERVSIDIPPDLEVRVSKGPGDERKVEGFDGLFLLRYQKLPEADSPPEAREPFAPAPLPLGYELVSAPIRVELNQAPEEPMMMKASATQADLSGLTQLAKLPMLRMRLPEATSEVTSDPEYLKKRMRVLQWIPEDRERAKPGKWEPIPPEAVVLDPTSKEVIFPADRVTTYVVVSERTPPSVRDLSPPPGARILDERPVLGATLVDKGTGVAVGAANRIDLRLDGRRLPITEAHVDAADPTEVKVRFPLDAPLAPGEHAVTLRGEDVVGNVATRQWRFVLDNVPPTVTAVHPVASGTRIVEARPVFAFELADPGSRLEPGRIEASLDGRPVAAGVLRFDPPSGLAVLRFQDAIAPGTHRIKVGVSDQGDRRGELELGFERPGAGGFLAGDKGSLPSGGPGDPGRVGGQPTGSPSLPKPGSGGGLRFLVLAGVVGFLLALARRRKS